MSEPFWILANAVLALMMGYIGASIAHITILHRVNAAESFLRAINVASARRERKDRDRDAIAAAQAEMRPVLADPLDIEREARRKGIIQ